MDGEGGEAPTAPANDTAPPAAAAAADDAPAAPAPPSKPAGAMSVEEMLAAAKAEKSGGAAKAAPAEPSAPAAAGPAKKAGEMSVAEMLAAARAENTAPAAPAAKPKPASAKPAAAKASPKPPTKVKPGSQAMDTASILATARKVDQPGPITKAEAAKRQMAPPKKKITAPVMPEKPAYALAPTPKDDTETRRGFMSVFFGSFLAVGFTCLAAVSAVWGLGLARFMFPNILTEPPSKFKVGFPGDFAAETVTTKYKAQYGVWIVNTEYEGVRQITALKSVCTHLGCTPNWLEGEQKYKCPCHGSGFYKDGINFEGPAPRPLERYAISVAGDGQIEIDKSKKFQQEMGQWNTPACYVKV